MIKYSYCVSRMPFTPFSSFNFPYFSNAEFGRPFKHIPASFKHCTPLACHSCGFFLHCCSQSGEPGEPGMSIFLSLWYLQPKLAAQSCWKHTKWRSSGLLWNYPKFLVLDIIHIPISIYLVCVTFQWSFLIYWGRLPLLCANNWMLLKGWGSLILWMTGSITGPNHRLSARSVLRWDRCQWIFPSGFYLLLSPLIETCNSSGAIITLTLFQGLHIEIAPSVPLQYLTTASAPIFPFLTNELRVLRWPVNINHGENGRQWLTAPAREAQNEMKSVKETSSLVFTGE